MIRFLSFLSLLPFFLILFTQTTHAADTTPDSYGTEKGQQLFSPENAQKLIPYKGDSPTIADFGKSAEFFRDSTNAYAPTPSPQAQFENFFNALRGLFDEVFARLFSGGIPFFGTIYTNGTNAPKLTETEETKNEFNRGVDEYIDSLNPFNANPFRITSGIASAFNMQSENLKGIINSAAEATEVPAPLLLAISQTEAPGAFSYTDEDVKFFSTDNWWAGSPYDTLKKGYCYNTCSDPSLGCPNNDVRGATQFEAATWRSLINDNASRGLVGIQSVLQSKFGLNKTITADDRCNVAAAFVGTAVKIKRDAGATPAWDEPTIRKVAGAYCGTCNPSRACGPDYCGTVWRLFKSYSSQSQ
ncbi:MAG: hypothetical protein A2782_03855 [Candidatus Blackburnbacteria bacterium RIFCSPHIGHO2_01_FULL_43_15b]|uniref:Transglycosylase SLT domain-containing protein n=1 Tax=Candidatus Blackburnbacteria bacterium RIFCSPHIGHO2_01_FULL_43_15b TaxID=1797513 RepID=A0A1G1UYA1_9BACT|nr:MAG: hypothetical protein A2782_03855 [Candidatus Blackburnbacteria bacterium RIFCSPHIGHO2_01_FULL_43_15b]